jgi:hypothetical protein
MKYNRVSVKKSILGTVVCAAFVSFSTVATAEEPIKKPFQGGASISTLGIGTELGYRFTPYIGMRGGYHYFAQSFKGRASDIDYNAKVQLQSFGGTVDVYPFRRFFRMSLGARYNANTASLTGHGTSDTIDIGDAPYNTSDIGTLKGRVDFPKIAPVATIGVVHEILPRLLVSFDIGAMYQGAGRVSLHTTNGNPEVTNDDDFKGNLEKERLDIQDTISKYRLYPVASIGISYRF